MLPSSPLSYLVEEKVSAVQLPALPWPFPLLCRMVSDQGMIRGFLLSLEIKFFPKGVGANKRKCLLLEPHIFQSSIFTEKPLRWCTISFQTFASFLSPVALEEAGETFCNGVSGDMYSLGRPVHLASISPSQKWEWENFLPTS